MELAEDTVYKTQGFYQQKERGDINSICGNLEIAGSSVSVEVYESNAETKPTPGMGQDVSDVMTLSQTLSEGVYSYKSPAKWIAFLFASGSPTLRENFLVRANAA